MRRIRAAPASSLILVAVAGVGSTAHLLRGSAPPERLAYTYQQAVGGLGAGPSQTLQPCPAAFDFRLAVECAASIGRMPGGESYCLGHSGLAEIDILRRPRW